MNNTSDVDHDDEIFVLKRRKPVGKITKEEALEIKRRVLEKEFFNSNCNLPYNEINVNSPVVKSGSPENSVKSSLQISTEKRKRMPDNVDDEIMILSEKVTRRTVEIKGTWTERGGEKSLVKTKISPEKLSSKPITNYLSPCKSIAEVGSSVSPNDEVYKGKTVKNDSAILVGSPKLITNTRKLRKLTSHCNFISSSGDSESSEQIESKLLSSYCYSRGLREIIHYEVLNQASLENEAVKRGEDFNKIFTPAEYNAVRKFFKLPDNAFDLYARMLCRKKEWHRIPSINYKDINGKMQDIFTVLNKNGFVDFNMNMENLETLLNLLNKNEVLTLCRMFNIELSKTESKKSDLIAAYLKSEKTQRSLFDLWGCGGKTREKLLKDEVLKTLGPCMKLNESFLRLLNRFLLLFSLSHEMSDFDCWSLQIYMTYRVRIEELRFPYYEVKPTVIFGNRDDFITYEKAMELFFQFNASEMKKMIEAMFVIGQKAKKEFKQLLDNEGYKERIRHLPPFLRRFTAGSVYAKILTMYCEKGKKNKSPDELIQIMEMLINQDVFSVSKKGKWYNILILAYSNSGKQDEAGSTLLHALKTDELNDVQRLSLQQLGGSLLKKKRNGLKKKELLDELDELCVANITDPPRIDIRGKALDKNKIGSKVVYKSVDDSGNLNFSSVEKLAINHYRNNGYPNGVHDEGFMIKTMYFLIFFDIIYKLSPPGVFQNPYQSEPLDFWSESFYLNRKTEIDSRLDEMRTWSTGEFEDRIKKSYAENVGVECVIKWGMAPSSDVMCEVFNCLRIPQFIRICERLVRNFRVFGSGFPDLTVWNPSTGKCKFVEVKSPNDKLSPKQRLWLHFLMKHDINCEVCDVKNTASRRMSTSKRLCEKTKEHG